MLAVLLILVSLLAAIAGAVVALWALRSRVAAPAAASPDAVTAAVEQLSLERDATLDALRAQLEAERDQLARERDRALQATIETVLSVAGDKLGVHAEHASRELHLRGEAIDHRVEAMNEELRRVRDLVAQLQKEKAEQHGQLVQGIDQAIRASAALTDTAQSLRQALSNSRARGQWGERMADDVLRVAGLVEGINYRRQQTLRAGTRPDFTFLLPRDRLLHMDVKFPVDNYLRVLEAASDGERAEHTRAFLRDVRSRVRELTGREYIDADSTVGYVLLFIPNESVYGFIHENDPRILDEALSQQVVLCSPSTLFAVLGVVRQAVDNFLIERTSDEILECLSGFTRQWVAFSEKLDRLGSQFATAQRTYDELAGTRRRQLQKQLDRVEQLRSATGLGELERATGSPELEPARSGSDDRPVPLERRPLAAPDDVPSRTVRAGDEGGPQETLDELLASAGGSGERSGAVHPASTRRITRLRPVRPR